MICTFFLKKSKNFTDRRTNRLRTKVIRKAQLNLGSGELKLLGLTPPG